MHNIVLDPSEDGVTHIRVCSHAKTKLGRYLMPNARTPFSVPGMWKFDSFDAFRIWFVKGQNDDRLRVLCNHAADQHIRELRNLETPEWQMSFRLAFMAKLTQTKIDGQTLEALLIQEKLPVYRYDVEDGDALIHPMPSCMQGVFDGLIPLLPKRKRKRA